MKHCERERLRERESERVKDKERVWACACAQMGVCECEWEWEREKKVTDKLLAKAWSEKKYSQEFETEFFSGTDQNIFSQALTKREFRSDNELKAD